MRTTLCGWAGPALGIALITGVGAALVGSAVASEDETTRASRSVDDATQALGIGEILARLEAKGYRDFYEVEREHGRYEVKARNAEGEVVELYVSATSGEILRSEYED